MNGNSITGLRRLALWTACVCLVAPASAFEVLLRLPEENADLQKNLGNASLVQSVKREGITAPLDILSAAQQEYGRLLSTLYNNGYYSPKINILVDGREAANIPPLERLTSVNRVDIRVDPGAPFRLGRAQVGPLTPDTEIPEGFAIGKPALAGLIGETAETGIEGWRAEGHAKAAVDRQSVTADHARSQLDVIIGLDPGPRVRFGQVNVPNESRVRKPRIMRIAGIPRGKQFDPVELDRAVERLRRTGAFSSVSIREAETLGPDETLDIDLELVDAKRRRFGFGAEVQSVEGLTFSAFWLHRNLFGGAERFKIETEFSGLGGETDGVDSTLRLSFNRPSTFDSDTDLYALLEIEQLDEPLYYSEQINAEVGISHYWSENLEGKIGIGYRYSDVNDALGKRTFSHLVLPFSIIWDKRDNSLNATEGFYVEGEGLPFLGVDGSGSGGRAYLDARAYQSFGSSGLVLAGRLQFGSILGAKINEIPPDLLFLSGGSDTVRGQSYQSLSILTAGGRTGGRSFLGLAGEARIPVKGKFGAVAFYDIGYVGANSLPDDTGDWHSGAGVGVRYDTGIGPVRLDLAVPVTGPDTSGFEIYLGIGQAF